MLTCVVCQAQGPHPPYDSSTPLIFIYFECCGEEDKGLCESCIPAHITSSLEAAVFSELWEEDFVPYPCSNSDCDGENMPIANVADLAELFDYARVDTDRHVHEGNFARALALRETLRWVTYGPDKADAPKAAALQRALHGAGISRHLLGEDDTELQAIMVTTLQGIYRVRLPTNLPIFWSLIRRSGTTRECVVCAEDLPDTHIPDREAWRLVVGEFRGEVQRLVEPFPSAETLPACAATHALDVCRICVAAHIEMQLDDRGTAAVGSIPCPSADCGYVYTHEDVLALAGPKDSEEYERLAVLAMVVDEPAF